MDSSLLQCANGRAPRSERTLAWTLDVTCKAIGIGGVSPSMCHSRALVRWRRAHQRLPLIRSKLTSNSNEASRFGFLTMDCSERDSSNEPGVGPSVISLS